MKKLEIIVSEDAVSPVIGIMLMLVVVIIIAAVVSGFAGGLVTGGDKAPQISAECRIVNGGTHQNSEFDCAINGASEPVLTRDIEIATSWRASDGTTGGSRITGPNVSTGSFANTHFYGGTTTYHSPLGFGTGVNRSSSGSPFYPDQMYGNYSLTIGTRMHNVPYGYSGGYGVTPSTRYQYTSGSRYNYDTDMDGVQAILGREWWHLRAGDIVKVKMIHRPSGKVIFDQNIPVVG
ncbi:MAG: hypothetical protein A4E35_01094 [Methanoregula sp. PtaU1.Bin051]|nr:MAG: hypothetical protein A4E35_01094 [Methanoregula sp. PtaU1.Bin051]